MRSTCNYASNMSVMIQVRNVPEALHRRLKARAALEGQSLSDYLLKELARVGELPTAEEMQQRLASRTAALTPSEIMAAVRAERDER